MKLLQLREPQECLVGASSYFFLPVSTRFVPAFQTPLFNALSSIND